MCGIGSTSCSRYMLYWNCGAVKIMTWVQYVTEPQMDHCAYRADVPCYVSSWPLCLFTGGSPPSQGGCGGLPQSRALMHMICGFESLWTVYIHGIEKDFTSRGGMWKKKHHVYISLLPPCQYFFERKLKDNCQSHYEGLVTASSTHVHKVMLLSGEKANVRRSFNN